MKTSNNMRCRKGGCLFGLVKLAVLVVVVLAVALYFSLSYVADYVLKTATSGTGIDAGVSSVSIGISEQKLEVRNFYISNPPNFKKCNAIEFKDAVIDADIDVGDVLSKKLIVLDEIKVVGLKMDLDIKTDKGLSAFLKAPVSNLTEIKESLAKKFGIEQKSSDGASSKTTQNSQSVSRDDQWKIIIKKMVFDDGTVYGTINKESLTVAIPSFSLENIGVEEGGETPSELVADIVGQLSAVATTNLVKAAIKGGEDGADGAGKAVKNVLKSIFK